MVAPHWNIDAVRLRHWMREHVPYAAKFCIAQRARYLGLAFGPDATIRSGVAPRAGCAQRCSKVRRMKLGRPVFAIAYNSTAFSS